jgi:hypothetical protein
VYIANPVIHDITVTQGSLQNVVQNSRGANMNLDMHRCAGWLAATVTPHEAKMRSGSGP